MEILEQLEVFEWEGDDVKAEHQLFAASPQFAQRHGGPITDCICRQTFSCGFAPEIIDTKIHLLMPGMYPGIPGWHLDEIPRIGGLPQIHEPAHKAEHLLLVVDCGTGSLTQFLVLSDELDRSFANGLNTYKEVNQQIQRELAGGGLSATVCSIPSCHFVQFGYWDWHRAAAATGHGWRLFFRATRNTRRPIQNEIRTQCQVYLDIAEAGW